MAAAFVSNGPAIDPECGICPSEIGVQYQPDGRLSTLPKNTATFTGKLLIVSISELVCLSPYCHRNRLGALPYLAIFRAVFARGERMMRARARIDAVNKTLSETLRNGALRACSGKLI
jgi:hypothetical protein